MMDIKEKKKIPFFLLLSLFGFMPVVYSDANILSDTLPLFAVESSESKLRDTNFEKAEALSDFARALIEFRKPGSGGKGLKKLLDTLEKDPSAAIPVVLVYNYWRENNKDKSIVKRIFKIAEANPDAIRVNITAAAMLADRDDKNDIEKLLENCFEHNSSEISHPSESGKLFISMSRILARLYGESGHFDKGIAMFDKILDGENSKLKNNLGLLSEALRFYDLASEQADASPFLLFFDSDKEILQKKFNEVLTKINILCSKRSYPPKLLIPLVKIYREKGMEAVAENLLLGNLLSEPENIPALMMLGQFYQETEKYRKAFAVWRALEKRKAIPPGTSSRINYATAALKLGYLRKAAEIFEIHSALNPSDSKPPYLLGIIYFETRQYHKALKRLNQAVPNFNKFYMRALCYDNLEDYQSAARQMELAEYVAEKMKKHSLLNKGFYLTAALIAEKAGKRLRAIRYLKKIKAKLPEDPEIMNFLGYLYAENGTDLDEAEKLVREALKYSPDNKAYLDSLAWIFYRKGQFKKALEQIKKAVGDESEIPDSVIADHAGDIYIALGKRKEALKYWKKALEIYSETLDREAVEAKIRKNALESIQEKARE